MLCKQFESQTFSYKQDKDVKFLCYVNKARAGAKQQESIKP